MCYFSSFKLSIDMCSLKGVLFSTAPNRGAALVALQNIWRLLNSTTDRSEGGEKHFVQGLIEFLNVDFSYTFNHGKKQAENLSFKILPGETLALVGQSGSGKSTAIGLLEQFYTCTSGQILIDGKDIQSLNSEDLHQQMALVVQEPPLFRTSIRENIVYGLTEVPSQVINFYRKISIYCIRVYIYIYVCVCVCMCACVCAFICIFSYIYIYNIYIYIYIYIYIG